MWLKEPIQDNNAYNEIAFFDEVPLNSTHFNVPACSKLCSSESQIKYSSHPYLYRTERNHIEIQSKREFQMVLDGVKHGKGRLFFDLISGECMGVCVPSGGNFDRGRGDYRKRGNYGRKWTGTIETGEQMFDNKLKRERERERIENASRICSETSFWEGKIGKNNWNQAEED